MNRFIEIAKISIIAITGIVILAATFYGGYNILMLPFSHPELNWGNDMAWAFLLLMVMGEIAFGIFALRFSLRKIGGLLDDILR
jgi:hypothetical protein